MGNLPLAFADAWPAGSTTRREFEGNEGGRGGGRAMQD